MLLAAEIILLILNLSTPSLKYCILKGFILLQVRFFLMSLILIIPLFKVPTHKSPLLSILKLFNCFSDNICSLKVNSFFSAL